MRKARDLLRLCLGSKISGREAARSLKISSSTASVYLRRAREAGLQWPLPPEMDEEALERVLLGPKAAPVVASRRAMPAIAQIKRELSRPDMTLALMWTEYKQDNPDGYGYSRFCELVRRDLRKLDLVLRQEHRGGEQAFIDWAGKTVPIIDADTGEVSPASIFVAVLPASNYTFLEGFGDQKAGSWIRGHVHAYEFFGGVPAITKPDNTKTAVTSPSRYEPGLHQLYEDLARHYGTAIIPARVRKPRDKAAVEVGVQVVQRWALAALRHHTVFSLAELNVELRGRQDYINARPFRHMPGSRRELFEQVDRPALRPLPAERYEWIGWKTAKVGPDYHVQVAQRYYSLPFQHIGEQVEVRISPAVVEILHKGRRVASHLRCYTNQKFITDPEHMPSSHRRYAEWTPTRLCNWAAGVGPATAEWVQGMLDRRPHPEQGFRAAMGLLRLAKTYTPGRVETACRRALDLGAYSYRSVESMLRSGLEQAPPRRPAQPIALPLPGHENVRGPGYYKEDH